MDEHFLIDTTEDALFSLEHLRDALPLVEDNPYEWKWAIIFLHNALQGFIVGTLRDSAGLTHLKDKVASKWLKAHREGTPYPKERMDSFPGLYDKIKSDRMIQYVMSKKFEPNDTQDDSVTRLNIIRNDFVHFIHNGYHLETVGLPRIMYDCLSVIDFLVMSSGNFFWVNEGQMERFKVAFEGCMKVIDKYRDTFGE